LTKDERVKLFLKITKVKKQKTFRKIRKTPQAFGLRRFSYFLPTKS